MHYLLIYDLAPDYLERRAAFRDEHLRLAWQAADRGDLVLGGAAGEPPAQSFIVFSCARPDVPAAFAAADPYVLNGVVASWRVEPWRTVVGTDATEPLGRP